MFSRTVRAVSCRALASSLRPIAAPVSRQVAPQFAQPQRRHYHEKVLDRASPPNARLFPHAFQVWSISNILCDRLLSPAQCRHIRQVGQLSGRGIGGSAGRMSFPASARHPSKRALKYVFPAVRRCYAAPYQGRSGDTGHQRRAIQDFRLRFCHVRALLLLDAPTLSGIGDWITTGTFARDRPWRRSTECLVASANLLPAPLPAILQSSSAA